MILMTDEFDSKEFVDASVDLHARLPNSVIYSIENAGGFATWERPLAVNNMVYNFLKGQDAVD